MKKYNRSSGGSLVGDELQDVGVIDRVDNLVVHAVVHAQMAVCTDEKITVIQRKNAVGNKILEVTTRQH